MQAATKLPAQAASPAEAPGLFLQAVVPGHPSYPILGPPIAPPQEHTSPPQHHYVSAAQPQTRSSPQRKERYVVSAAHHAPEAPGCYVAPASPPVTMPPLEAPGRYVTSTSPPVTVVPAEEAPGRYVPSASPTRRRPMPPAWTDHINSCLDTATQNAIITEVVPRPPPTLWRLRGIFKNGCQSGCWWLERQFGGKVWGSQSGCWAVGGGQNGEP